MKSPFAKDHFAGRHESTADETADEQATRDAPRDDAVSNDSAPAERSPLGDRAAPAPSQDVLGKNTGQAAGGDVPGERVWPASQDPLGEETSPAARDDLVAENSGRAGRGDLWDEEGMPAADRDVLGEEGAPAAGHTAASPVPATAQDPLSENATPAAATPVGAEPAAAEPAPGETPTPQTPQVMGSASNPGAKPLMGDQVRLRAELQEIQATFVDDPAGSVRRAADLAESTAETLLVRIRQQTSELRTSWDGGEGGHADTETLRNALRTYRVFIDHLAGV